MPVQGQSQRILGLARKLGLFEASEIWRALVAFTMQVRV